ncbi:hypothetical protein A3A70_02210 [candidate division WWE3 bacterium RIFCSPLOWO2_01_FULL_42_11]|uniref:LysM domain-containing protein n=1 Tax=candidate division WWE3 bacterium RIFCSPLOWO2_01_FULL_42_11 TaxID=1802627 RepID=A0A1F4VND9_UNCKA|nr:MAG: hypothetical protein A3A70_02210 [candidate division WWE3 bacterium RIFCSPLOWO2_01_FULL_42_11]
MAVPIEDLDDDDLQVSRNSLTVLITGILIIIAAFVTYNFFANRSNEAKNNPDVSVAQLQDELNKKDEGKSDSQQKPATDQDTTGGISGGSLGTTDVNLDKATGGPVAGVESAWIATDMVPNSITVASYQVQTGDTLWEIAEARYGSGYEWTKILSANINNVGFLQNGSQALIAPGQSLVLPN